MDAANQGASSQQSGQQSGGTMVGGVHAGAGVSGSGTNGEFAPRLSQALESMDTELMHRIVTEECAHVLVRKVNDFLSFFSRLSSGNKAILKGVAQQPNVVEKLRDLKSEIDNFSSTTS